MAVQCMELMDLSFSNILSLYINNELKFRMTSQKNKKRKEIHYLIGRKTQETYMTYSHIAARGAL